MEADKDEENAGKKPDDGLNDGETQSGAAEGQDAQKQTCPCDHKAGQSNQLPWWKDSQWWQVIVAGVLVPFGVYAVLVYSWQLDEMRKSTDAATKAARASEASVRIAEENRKKSDESERLDRRAWVTARTVRLEKPLAAGEHVTISVECLNSGKTLAFDMKLVAAIITSPEISKDALIEVEKHLRGKQDMADVSRLIIAPNGTTNATAVHSEALTQEQFDAIQDGSMNLYIEGYIEYRDEFDMWHRTTYCHWTNGKAVDKVNMMGCPSGNAAD